MAKFKVNCGNCSQTLEADDEWIGMELPCPVCGKKIKLQEITLQDVAENGDNEEKGVLNGVMKSAFGVDKLQDFNFVHIVQQIFKFRKWEEKEDYLSYGVPCKTPELAEIDTSWPAPWLFVRVITFTILSTLFLIWKMDFLGMNNVYLPIVILGIVGIPMATLVLFWELNVARNVSFLSLCRIAWINGLVSIVATIIICRFVGEYSNAIWAGPIEETAKAIAMLFFIGNKKYRFKLNGLLIGAAVGAGFDIVETGGYFINEISDGAAGNPDGMMIVRTLLSPFAHIPWSAMVGFALWRVKGNDGLSSLELGSHKFISLFVCAVGLHMFNNSTLLGDELIIKAVIIAAVEYSIIIYLVQDGINEIRQEKEKLLNEQQYFFN